VTFDSLPLDKPAAILTNLGVMETSLPEATFRTAMARKAKRALWVSLLFAVATMAASAAIVRVSARRAERKNPPAGKFISVKGVRLHYIDTGGKAPAVVLFHGNGSMIQEMEISGIVGKLAERYRVVAFDRPGFGYSDRPRSVKWTPAAQADLIHAALLRLGVKDAILVGHSWGTLVVLELALRHARFVNGMLLVGGFYFPIRRSDVLLLSIPAIPVLGGLLRNTVYPIIVRVLLPRVLRRTFAPRPVSTGFRKRFPRGLAVRPEHIRASAEDLAMMVGATTALQTNYENIRQPTIIIAGSGDRIVEVARHSLRLYDAIPGSELYVLPNDGHMVHHHAPLTILQAVDKLSERSRSRSEATG
jgi:pimeloyl-ACP methyl ester carboxylesterase